MKLKLKLKSRHGGSTPPSAYSAAEIRNGDRPMFSHGGRCQAEAAAPTLNNAAPVESSARLRQYQRPWSESGRARHLWACSLVVERWY